MRYLFRRRAAAALFPLLALLAPPALAQSPDEFRKAFAGQWFVFDKAYSDGASPCGLTLPQGKDAASTTGCTGPIASTTDWRIVGGKIALLGPNATRVALLGGNQFRVTGELENATPVVMERAEGTALTRDKAKAVARHGCFFKGYSADCTAPADLAQPAFDDNVAEIGLLTTMNVRAQPRGDAGIIGSIAKDTCVKVNACVGASDGLWCRARFGNVEGWLAKTAIRDGEWPVMTFANACSADPAEAPASSN